MDPEKIRRQKRKPTEVRRTEITEAAMHIIVTDGTRRLTAERIAAEVGVTSGAIFRHFPSMDAIVEAVIEHMDAILFEGFPPKARDPLERLGIFFRQRVRAIVENPHVSRLLFSDHLAHAAGRDRGKRIEKLKKRSREFVLACLQEAECKGQLGGPAGPMEGAVLVMGAILALAHTTTRTEPSNRVEALSRSVWSVLENTLRGTGRDRKQRVGDRKRKYKKKEEE